MSDFGQMDGYAGAVKGVIKSYSADIDIVDITHDIPSFKTQKAAVTLMNYYDTYPSGTVHLCVVDPGVGGDRAGIILETNDYFFVGPNNGIFDLIAQKEEVSYYQITAHFGTTVSATFHGRDIFAPIAARLASGINPEELAEKIEIGKKGQTPLHHRDGTGISVRPLTIDHFGNIIFGITKKELSYLNIKKIQFKNFVFNSIFNYYEQVDKGQLLCLWNSQNLFEIAVNQGNASEKIKVDFDRDELLITVEVL